MRGRPYQTWHTARDNAGKYVVIDNISGGTLKGGKFRQNCIDPDLFETVRQANDEAREALGLPPVKRRTV